MRCTIQISNKVVNSWHEMLYPLNWLFASRISTQIRTSPDFLGTTTIVLIQGVGPSTFSMSQVSSLSSSFSASSLTWNGILLLGCCRCITSGSMYNFTSLFGTFPMPPNSDLNSSLKDFGSSFFL